MTPGEWLAYVGTVAGSGLAAFLAGRRSPSAPTSHETPAQRQTTIPDIVVVDSHEDIVLRVRSLEKTRQSEAEATAAKIKKAAEDAASDKLIALVGAAHAKKLKLAKLAQQPKTPEEPTDEGRTTDPTTDP